MSDTFGAETGGGIEDPGSALYSVSGSVDNVDQNRKSIFGVDTREIGYFPGTFAFGAESAQRDYIIPMARFKFYTPFGDAITESPTLFIRMPGSFNSTLLNSYSPTTNIFGSPVQDLGGNAGSQIVALLNKIVEGGVGAVQRQILNALTEGAGFIGSAGLNARAQTEFLTRKMLNNYNQLIYQGPNFRRFQLPFSMKPSSETEAENMGKIIYTFRAASSPKAGNNTAGLEDKALGEFQSGKFEQEGNLATLIGKEKLTSEEQEQLNAYNSAVAGDNDIAALSLARETDVLTFGYPDMCRFQIVLYQNGQIIGNPLFKSDFCVIDSVSVDYGSGNKMGFFKNKYPTETTLTISLQEMSLVTAGSVYNQYNFIQ